MKLIRHPALIAYIAVQQHNLKHFAIAVDQLARVAVAILIGSAGWSDETLSAYAWRADRDGKVLGKVARVAIDALFFWQAVDPDITAEGTPIKSHCRRAFERECRKQYLPPEYRT